MIDNDQNPETVRLGLDSPEISERVAALSLEEKVMLLTGANLWGTHPIDRIGLRPIIFSDGPSGVRGAVWDERHPSLNLPSGTVLASSWDLEVAREYGSTIAAEARRKGVDVVLGPTVNLHRSPQGGRDFEAFSEDPLLTGAMAAAFVTGVQENGVAATPKHFVANDYETDRYTANSVVDDRTLREVYLAAFEQSVTHAHVWAIMSAYNSINGTTASESPLLTDPLKTDWGFDGVVVSDWTGVRTLASAATGQDLAMPGPTGPWGDALVHAVRSGEIAERVVDDKVSRILLLAARVGALAGVGHSKTPQAPRDGVAFARKAAADGAVLLQNDGLLPLQLRPASRVAVVGHHAVLPRTQGGGSATVVPASVTTPLAALRAALPDHDVRHAVGAYVQTEIAPIPLAQMRNAAAGEQGVQVRFLDEDGKELLREDRFATTFVYGGADAPTLSAASFEVAFTYLADHTGTHRIGFSAVGSGKIYANDELVATGTGVADGRDLGANLNQPPPITAALELAADSTVDIRIEFDLRTRIVFEGHEGMFGFFVGTELGDVDPADLFAAAVAEAAAAEVAIVVVGTTPDIESEGFDRPDLSLPAGQDALVAAIAATGTPTVVVLNVGAPVLMPWRDDVSAVLVTYFGGEQMAEALTDMLTGQTEPGGRLPTTWPVTGKEALLPSVTPVDGELVYEEGINIGYRQWLAMQESPAFSFGHGLGYSSWEVTALSISSGTDAAVVVDVTNIGDRTSKQVVQAYLSKSDSNFERPALWLAGWGVVRSEPGTTNRLTISLPQRVFEIWDGSGWLEEAGSYTLHVGTSSADLPLTRVIARD